MESNHQALPWPPLAGEVAPTGHIFQAESKGIEPSGLHLAQLSRLLADRSALPSMLTNQCALTPNLWFSLLDKDSNLNRLVQGQVTCR